MSFPITIIPREDFQKYPFLSRLLELHDVPDQIYVAGTIPEVTIDEYGRATPRILTIVGSRRNTQYGKNAVEKLIESLASEDVIIISGLAYGIDSIAHSGALKHNLKTIAVLANGLDTKVIYPKSHLSLAQDIVETGGALISELSPTTSAAQWTFPARNRMVAALSDAVLIAEASEKSGTLITARLALELGKDIGAIPGEIFSPTFVGTNKLIRDGAYIITDEDDLYALLHITKKKTKDIPNAYDDKEKIILELLKEPLEKDLLLIRSELSLEEFLTALSSLEIKGVIEETFGEVRRLV
jgi:DNA processing protein